MKFNLSFSNAPLRFKRLTFSFLAVFVLSTAAAQQPYMTRYIVLNVTQGEWIKLDFSADAADTPVLVRSGSRDTVCTTGIYAFYNDMQFFAETNTITIYGNVKELFCKDNGSKITHIDCANNTGIKKISCSGNALTNFDVSPLLLLESFSCYDNFFSTQALDSIYCALPDRTGLRAGRMDVMFNTAGANNDIAIASNGGNANAKNWGIWYYSNQAQIPTNGQYVCSGAIPTANVQTDSATHITEHSAVLCGSISPTTNPISERGFEWKLANGGVYTHITSSQTTDHYTVTLANLQPHTAYTFKAYATIGGMNVYGEEKTFTTGFETAANIHRYVTLHVTAGETVSLGFAADIAHTPIRIVSGRNIYDTIIGTGWTGFQQYLAAADTITVFGDVKKLDCGKVGNSISKINLDHNPALLSLYCNNTPLCENAAQLDLFYCSLFDRSDSVEGILCMVKDPADPALSAVLSSNTDNAKRRNWKMQYRDSNLEIPHSNGTHTCHSDLAATTDVMSEVKLYPNPVTTLLHIVAPQTVHHLEIMDLSGRVVLRQQPHQSTIAIDLSSITPDTYILKLTTAHTATVHLFVRK